MSVLSLFLKSNARVSDVITPFKTLHSLLYVCIVYLNIEQSTKYIINIFNSEMYLKIQRKGHVFVFARKNCKVECAGSFVTWPTLPSVHPSSTTHNAIKSNESYRNGSSAVFETLQYRMISRNGKDKPTYTYFLLLWKGKYYGKTYIPLLDWEFLSKPTTSYCVAWSLTVAYQQPHQVVAASSHP